MLFRFFRSPPYFYFWFCLYGHWNGRFYLSFACTAQQSVLDGTNGLSSSKPCVYCRIVWSRAWRGSLCDSTAFLLTSPPADRCLIPWYIRGLTSTKSSRMIEISLQITHLTFGFLRSLKGRCCGHGNQFFVSEFGKCHIPQIHSLQWSSETIAAYVRQWAH